MQAESHDIVMLAGFEGIIRQPRAGIPPTSAVLALHGYGGDCDELLPVVGECGEFLPRTLFFFARAPAPCGARKSGREWFPLTNRPDVLGRRIAETAPYVARLTSTLARAYALELRRIGLIGFSQGAMLALHAGLGLGVGAVVSFSGLLADCFGLAVERPPPPVYLVHGALDRMVTPAQVSKIQSLLGAAGGDVVTSVEASLGHEIAAHRAADVGSFLQRALGDECRQG